MASKLITAVPAALALLFAGAVAAQTGTIELGANPAVTIAGGDLPANDARVVKVKGWLQKIMAATGENEEQVAAAAMKLSRYLWDSAHMRAVPMETAEGMAAQAVSGKLLSDLTAGYFNARINTANKTHAEALAALAAKK